MTVVFNNKTVKLKTKSSKFTLVKMKSSYRVLSVSVASNDESMGSAYGSGWYREGSEVRIRAEAKAGFVFVRWSDGSTEPDRTLIVEEDITLVAYFEVDLTRGRLSYVLNQTYVDWDSIIRDGTVFLYKPRDNYRNIRIYQLNPANDVERAVIDWGDGEKTTLLTADADPTYGWRNISHEYQDSRLHVCKISDGIEYINHRGGNSNYAQYVIAANISFGSKLKRIGDYSFNGENVITDSSSAQYCGFNEQQLKEYVIEYTEGKTVTMPANLGEYSSFPLCQTLQLNSGSSGMISMKIFYAGGLSHVQNLILEESVREFTTDGREGSFNDFTGFMQRDGSSWYDCKNVYCNRLVEQIRLIPHGKNWSQFWGIDDYTMPIYFHGTDGVLDKYGNLIEG